MITSLLTANIIDGPLIISSFVASAVVCVFLLGRRPTRRWISTAVIALSVGVIAAIVIWFLVEIAFNVFGVPLGAVTYYWLAAGFAGVGLAIANLWGSQWWRKIVASCAIVLFLFTTVLGINAGFGLYQTLGTLLNISTAKPFQLSPRPTAVQVTPFDSRESLPASPHPTPVKVKTGALWETWQPSNEVPAVGKIATQVIPNTLSGFKSRPAGIYLPPAALASQAPALPFVIVMFGQPGNPVPEAVSQVLDPIAAQHGGLAPIVMVVDQLGNPAIDPLCLDTKHFGNAETFITKDVITWATANLNITKDHHLWAVAGYSNGGQCAISLAAKHPDIWSNVLDISGEEFPGAEHPAWTLKNIFGNKQAAYDAEKPINIMRSRNYPGMNAIFTIGALDAQYIPVAKRLASAATAAGMTTFYREIPNGEHVRVSVNGGLVEGFQILYSVLGLAPPVK